MEPEILGNVLEACKETKLPKEKILIFDNREGQVVPEGFESWRCLLGYGEGGWEGWDDGSGERSRGKTAARLFSSGECFSVFVTLLLFSIGLY